MNENKQTADWLRKVSNEAKKKADELDPPFDSGGDISKPVGIPPTKPRPDNLAWARSEAKKKKELDASKQLSR
jgi:hypothetical protein